MLITLKPIACLSVKVSSYRLLRQAALSLKLLLLSVLCSPVIAIETPARTVPSGKWAQLSLPADASNLTIRALFADELAANEYNNLWVIYYFDSVSGEYVNPGIDGSLPQSAGFWMMQITDSAVSLQLPSTIPAASATSSSACAADQCSIAPITSRNDAAVFNFIGSAQPGPSQTSELRLRSRSNGSPCAVGCALDTAVAQRLLRAPLWHYDTATNNYIDLGEIGQIGPWQGVWMRADTGLSNAGADLLFPVSVYQPSSLAEQAAASRFLAQTTFGPTTESIDELLSTDYSSWLDAQIALPATSMLDSFDQLQSLNPSSAPSRDWVFESFWTQAVEADDQLRQRMAFALSQIFVISLREGAVASFPRGVADFYRMLSEGAFGNFRDLLEEVTLHPMMGSYLSHLGNEKGDPVTGKVPDENFAREIMQLFTIGLHELNEDGSLRLDAGGNPIETYSNDDVQGLAKVFTGFSWNGPDTSTGRFQGWISVPNRDVLPMQPYAQFHSTLEKRFIGTVIEAQQTPDPAGDLSVALDALFNHSNVGPFIGRQLIQRLVSSNPSQDYVARVTAAFNNNGEGVRGDMRAVVRAVLLDPEARTVSQSPTFGKIREPILRLAHWMRSFDARSANDGYIILGTDDPATSIGMTVLRSPSVFNFYRPGYVPANTPIAAAGLVSPEMQITHETSVAGYLNSMLNTVELGTGSNNAISSDYSEAAALSAEPQSLIDHLNVLLLHGSMSSQLESWLTEAIESVDLQTADDLPQALQRRARIAIYLTMASPEYNVLK